ncbi:MAG: HD domain-containing protein, partial [Candidatus Thorarchaeota archaeon]
HLWHAGHMYDYYRCHKCLCNQGKQKDALEFNRTLKHILRSFKIFFLLIEDNFSHETLSEQAEAKIAEKTKRVDKLNKNLLPLILLYHDLGRFVKKRDHPSQSYKLLSENDLLEPYGLNQQDILLVKKIIQYHLFFATIYTGESTFYGIYSLLNDKELMEMFSEGNYHERFIDLLEIFTFIDVLGYPYSQIYDHYIKYYNEINLKLKTILSLGNNIEKALTLAYDYSLSWINWRLAGALRIFQFVETEPDLTVEFYFQKLEESILKSSHPLLKHLDLKKINQEFLKPSCKVQLKYALGFLMILAVGRFSRSKLSEKTEISDKLLLFWIFLSNKIKQIVSERDNYLWNVYIIGIKNWFDLNQTQLSAITEQFIQKTINSATFEFIQEKEEYSLLLNFEELTSNS